MGYSCNLLYLSVVQITITRMNFVPVAASFCFPLVSLGDGSALPVSNEGRKDFDEV